MVCETAGRVRSLNVNRRGGFLDDPFFQDAWDDYHHAVRGIVDRFNHGFFNSPRDRLRDSQYHSMYRTLRSARSNVAQQSAKFKDEGDHYKLVMDVHEFVGGEVTVRTSGGCVSVRGRLEENCPPGGDAESESSRASNISNKTLHRRFTLPPDADGEKVVSTLSKDAVLTVTIPKRSDVRVIPVTFEKDSSSDASSGRSGTKRQSITQPDLGPTPSKRIQEYKENNISPDRQKRGSKSPDKDKRKEKKNRRKSNGEVNIEILREDMGRKRKGSKKNKDEESSQASIVEDEEIQERRERRRKSVNERNKQSNDLPQNPEKRSSDQGKRRSSKDDMLDEQEKLGASSYNHENKGDLSRGKRTDSHGINKQSEKRRSEGEVREFNIPIHIEGELDSPNLVKASQRQNIDAKNIVCNGTAQNEEKINLPDSNSNEIQDEDPIPKISEASNKNEPKQRKLPTFAYKNIDGIKTEKENIEPSSKDWVYSMVYDDEDTNLNDGNPSAKLENTSHPDKGGTEETQQFRNKENNVSKFNDFSNGDLKITDVLKRIKEKNIKISKDATELCDELNKNDRLKKDFNDDNKDGKSSRQDSSNENSPNNGSPLQRTPKLDFPKSSEQIYRHNEEKSPNSSAKNLEPQDNSPVYKQELLSKESPKIGRVIPIEAKQEAQEEDMFKDCWKNFSSTLQDVLARLQELSSDLGESRLMTSTEDGGQNQSSSADNKWCGEKQSSSVAGSPDGGTGAAAGSGQQEVGSGVGGAVAMPTLTHPPTPSRHTGPTTPPPSLYAAAHLTRSPGPHTRPSPDGTRAQHPVYTNAPSSTPVDAHGEAVGGQDMSSSSHAQVLPPPPFRLSEGVPDVPRWRGVGGRSSHGGGGVTTTAQRPASLALHPSDSGASSTGSPPQQLSRHRQPTSLLQDLPLHTPQESRTQDVLLQEAQAFSAPRPVRPTSLSIVPGGHGGSLIESLRKGSPVEALKDSFLTRLTPSATPTTEGATGGWHSIPVLAQWDHGAGETTCAPAPCIPLPWPDTCTPVGDVALTAEQYRHTAPLVSSDTHTGTHRGIQDPAQHSGSPNQSQLYSSSGSAGDPCGDPDPYRGPGGAPPTHYYNPTTHHHTSPPTTHYQLSPSDDAEVDDLIAKAHRVIEETRKLTQGSSESTALGNDLSSDNSRIGSGATAPVPYNTRPNIENTTRSSPESNILSQEEQEEQDNSVSPCAVHQEFKDYSDDEDHREAVNYSVSGVGEEPSSSRVGSSREEQGRQSRARHQPHRGAGPCSTVPHAQVHHTAAATSPVYDDGSATRGYVTELNQDSLKSSEIGTTSDVMGTAKRGVSGGGATSPPACPTVILPPEHHTGRGPRQQTPRTAASPARTTRAADHTHRDHAGPTKPRESLATTTSGSGSHMGGYIGRTRTTSPAAPRQPRGTTGSSTGTSPVTTPSGTFSARAAQRLHEGTPSSGSTRDEKHLPPAYVRQTPKGGGDSNSTKRYSGFGCVSSGNVGKMRDLWGSRQVEKQKPPTPASTPPTSRKTSESPRSPRKTTPRPSTPPTRGDHRDSPKPRVESPGPRASPVRRGSYEASPHRRGSSSSATRDAGSPVPTSSGRRRGSSTGKTTLADSAAHVINKAPATPKTQNKPSESRRRDSKTSPEKYSPGRGLGGHYASPRSPKEQAHVEPREPPPQQPTTFHQKLFKKLRDSSLQPDSETISFKESNGKYKLVMDVEAYVPGEIEVNNDDKVLTVRGRVELTTSDGGSTIRTFHRTFNIPNSAKEEDIDSALSQDGYLTVFVPKKRERVIKIELTD